MICSKTYKKLVVAPKYNLCFPRGCPLSGFPACLLNLLGFSPEFGPLFPFSSLLVMGVGALSPVLEGAT